MGKVNGVRAFRRIALAGWFTTIAAWGVVPAIAQTGASPTPSPSPGAAGPPRWVLACDGATVGLFNGLDAPDPKLAQSLRDQILGTAAPTAKSEYKNVEITLREGTAEPDFVQWVRSGAAGADVVPRNCTATKSGAGNAPQTTYTLRHVLPANDSVINASGLTAGLLVGTLQLASP
jgi:hypothetical protein